MSKIVYICSRDGHSIPYRQKHIEYLSKMLTPDNISPKSPFVREGEGVLLAVFNPVDSLPVHNLSVCMGALIGEGDDWWKPGAEAPDGSYALLRGSDTALELLSDVLGTRSLWYVQTERLFIASTSQRALVFLLGGYQRNRAVYPWMLSSGTLGPGLSWDARIRFLGPDSRLFLDRSSWKTAVVGQPVNFSPRPLSDECHEEKLAKAVRDTFEHLHLNWEKSVLSLSGGLDSRGILLMLKDRPGIRTVTWGLGSALDDVKSDACVARSLARFFDVNNVYYETDISDEPMEILFERFLVAGEGRTDRISGYMDGFKIWKELSEASIEFVIRGDEGFGCMEAKRPWEVYRNMKLSVMSDFVNLPAPLRAFGNGSQQRRSLFERRINESIEAWRDRLNHQFEFPVVFGALNDLKLPYVEVINPLVSRRIAEQVRALPDHLRTNKKLFRKVVQSMSPPVEFARYPAIQSRQNILRTPHAVHAIVDRLERARSTDRVLPKECLDFALTHIQSKNGEEAYPSSEAEKLIFRLKEKIKQISPMQIMDPNIFAFRAYIISRMTEMLTSDARAIHET